MTLNKIHRTFSQTVDLLFSLVRCFVSIVLAQFPDGHLRNGLLPDGQFPDGQFPEGQFPERTIPRMEISPTDSSPNDISPNGHFPELHFFIYLNLYLLLVYKSSRS